MGEVPFPPATAENQLNNHHFSPPVEDNHRITPNLPNGEEEPYTIKCICTFDDDQFDGNTVFCDRCNTWQHIACYYFPSTTLEDDFEHTCVDCNPSQGWKLNSDKARARQEELRHPQITNDDRRPKRPGPKSHRKNKTRDLTQTNGFSAQDPLTGDFKASSPKEQGPPSKRAKTGSHRHSISIGSNFNPLARFSGSRKNSVSSGLPPLDPPKPPLSECPADYFSPEFIQVHRENTSFQPVLANTYVDISVTNMLASWLDDEDNFIATTGKRHDEVFLHYPNSIEDIENPIEKQVAQNTSVQFHDNYPIWPYLTVAKDLLDKDFVGEIRGSIGHRKAYVASPENKWSKIRHPDHFVFFHPMLPIYIDARTEGTLLRYARRSCQPNMRMKTIITGQRDYRFCFMASRDIPRGTELTIPWDIHDDLRNSLARGLQSMNHDEHAYVDDWVSTVLAYFGGCACDGSCVMANWDRRLAHTPYDPLTQSSKSRKKQRTPKTNLQLDENGDNGRATSDVPPLDDGDVDMGDSRSVTNSTGSKSNKTSRDATPSDHKRDDTADADHGLSEREKRKIMYYEQQAAKETHNQEQRKKKRTSGSNANTPTATFFKQQARPTNSSTQPVSHNNTKARVGQVGPPARPSSTSRSPVGHVSMSNGSNRPKQTYADASTQTDPPEDGFESVGPHPHKPFIPPSKRLLKRSLLRSQQQRLEKISLVTNGIPHDDAQQQEVTCPPRQGSSDIYEHISGVPVDRIPSLPETSRKDLSEMDLDHDASLSAKNLEQSPPQQSIEQPNDLSTVPMEDSGEAPKKPPPPWPSGPSNHMNTVSSTGSSRPANMHVELPPARTFKSESPFESPLPTGLTLANTVQSPQSAAPTGPMQPPPLISPSFQESKAITRPSPIKKKMSLSEYTKRKTETPTLERRQSQSQPSISNTSSPVAEEANKAKSPLAFGSHPDHEDPVERKEQTTN